MPKEARAEWRRMVKALQALGTLSFVDSGSLEIYCVAYDDWREAIRLGDVKGQDRAERVLMWFRKQYGLTWASRKNLATVTAKENPIDQWTKRLSGPN